MQRTVRQKVVFSGKGLHSGRFVRMEVLPALAHTGIVFERTDLSIPVLIPAKWDRITSTDHSTTISSGSVSVSTIEHLMAAFAGLGIDNVVVKINGPEVPIMDGSSKTFVSELLKAGVAEIKAPRVSMKLKKDFLFRDGDKSIQFSCASDFAVDCEIDFPNNVIGQQSLSYRGSMAEFLKIAQCRTFCHLREVELLRSVGLAQGGSLENAVVVSDDGILNADGLRCDDEFVRHKVLDLIGDILLLGAPLVAQIRVRKGGHRLHALAMRELMARADEYLDIVFDAADSSEQQNLEVPVARTANLAF